MDSKTVESFLSLEKEIHNAADYLFDKYRKLHISILGKDKIETGASWGLYPPYAGLRLDDISDNTLYYEADEYWSYGGHEHYSFTLPTRYLWEDWVPIETAKFQAILDKENAYLNARENANKQKELEQLAKLKEKYNE